MTIISQLHIIQVLSTSAIGRFALRTLAGSLLGDNGAVRFHGSNGVRRTSLEVSKKVMGVTLGASVTGRQRAVAAVLVVFVDHKQHLVVWGDCIG